MRKTLKFVRILSVTALICTVILWSGLWISSAIPGTKSGEHTDKVTNVVDGAFGISEKVNEKLNTYAIKVNVKEEKAVYFVSETAELNVEFKPKDTKDRDLYFYSEDDNVATVDENGIITFNQTGWIHIYAKLKSNDRIIDSVVVRCYGENAFDPNYPERANFKFVDNNGNESEPVVGEKRLLLLNEGKSDVALGKVSVEDESILYYWQGFLYGRKEGETKVTYKFNDESGEHEISKNVQVGSGTLPEIYLVAKGNIEYTHGTTIYKTDLLLISEESEYCNDVYVETSNDSIVFVNGNYFLDMNGIGEAVLTYTSCYDPANSVEINVKVNKKNPNSIMIVGSDSIVCNETDTYIAKTFPIQYNNEVVWSVESGKGEIDQNGNLTANGYGKIVIRCTSKSDESVYEEKEVNVKLFLSAYGFVRKAMGHMGLSVCLGFGIFGTLYLLLKRRYLIITSLPLSFGYAYISELIQKITPGRFFSTNDVLIDFIGSLIGIAFAMFTIFIVCVIWRLVNKQGYRKFRTSLKLINFKTMFKKDDELLLSYEKNRVHEPSTEEVSEITTDVLTSNEEANNENPTNK